MKLYNVDLSPFAARCRIQIYAKGGPEKLGIAFEAPPGGISTDAYKKLVPTGKVPALAVDGGEVIAESTAICEYLEDRFPEPSLRPADPETRARMRTICQVTDLYVVPPLAALFGQANPKVRDAKLVAEKLAELGPRYDQLAAFLRPGPYAVGKSLSLADCTLVPLFFFATRLHPLLGDKDPTADRPALARWWEGVHAHDAVTRVEAELGKALAESMRAASS